MQRLKKAIKKMAAIGTGVAMLGATITGAMALDLAEYPAPFVKNGVYDAANAIIVGARAAASDTLGAVDVATNLQFLSKTCVSGSGAGATSISGDSVGITDGSDMLELRETLGNVRETMTELELDGLRGGLVTTNEGSTEYNQYLRFTSVDLNIDSPLVNFTGNDDNVEDVADYLYIKEGTNESTVFFEYELQFSEGLESDIVSNKLDDLEDEELVILGQVYNVVDTKIDTTLNEVTVELLGGNVFDTLEEGEQKTYTVNGKDYKVEVLIIEDVSPETATFRINGKLTDQLLEGETEVLDDGTLVGVSDIINNEAGESGSGDIVEFYIGAHKLELKDTEYTDSVFEQRVDVDNENIEDAWVSIKGNELDSTTYEIQTIKYRLNADALPGSNDIYVAAGHGIREYLDEPQGMLGDWDIRYEGLTDTGVSIIKLDPSGDDEYKLVFESREGKVYKMPYLTIEGGTFKYGDDKNELVFREGTVRDLTGSITAVDYFNIGLDDWFILSNQKSTRLDDTAFTHVIRFDNVDTANNQLRFSDLAGGNKDFSFTRASVNSTGKADLVFGGSTYTAILGPSAIQGATGNQTIAVDQNSDGDIAHDEINPTINGGGVLLLGPSVGNQSGPDFNESQVNWTGNGKRIGTLTLGNGTFADIQLSLVTISENFDENTPTSLGGSATNEQINFTVVTRAGNELGIASYTTGANLTNERFTLKEPDTNEDHLIGLSDYGTYLDLYDPSTGGQDAETLTVEYPLKQRGAEVFVTMGATSTTKTKSGQICTVADITPNTMLDTEVGSRVSDYNLILVGGPCANDAVSRVAGFPTCDAWSYKPGEAVIQLAANGNKVAMLVAGTDAIDTRMAAKVVANHEDYSMTGSKAMVTGTFGSPKVSVAAGSQ